MDKISLNASMRNNLLSLQNISKSVSLTQNRLSTGLKVNSAIDNPSSYYTARSLNNRANDLSALLDSMGQAIQTIKAATTGLEAGAELLAQASAVATQALETCTIPAKSYFEQQVGPNGAVVTTAEELKQAIADNKETICVYGKISLENEIITLNDGQKLVGTEYYTGYTGRERFSSLNIKQINLLGDNHLSDLDINITQSVAISYSYGIRVWNENHIGNISLNFSTQTSDYSAGIIVFTSISTLNMSGNIDIQSSGINAQGIYVYDGAILNSCANVNTTSIKSNTDDGRVNLSSGSVNLTDLSASVAVGEKATLNISNGAFVTDKSSIYGKLNIKNAGINMYGNGSLTAMAGSEINIYKESSNKIINNFHDTALFTQKAGSKINVFVNGTETSLLAKEDFSYNNNIFVDTLKDSGKFAEDESFSRDWNAWLAETEKFLPQPDETKVASDQYSSILNQYDSLIKDSSYKGVNVLSGDALNVRFNEDSSSTLDVQGKDMGTSTLGVNAVAWKTQDDIAQSMQELADAVKQIRSFQTELGNNYSIITNRQEFTESLINVLTEGADKLTLADMNEESANMLALQTRQQLAVNALSLASQASQGILKLF